MARQHRLKLSETMSPSVSKSVPLKADFAAVLKGWRKSLEEPKTEFTRDSAILRFELAYEVSWKLLQVLLREQGYEVNSPRQAFQQAFSIGWVRDEEVWDDVIRARNMATHVYREADAEALFARLSNFHEAFAQLAKALPS